MRGFFYKRLQRVKAEMTDTIGFLNCAVLKVDTKHPQQKISAKLKLKNQIAEPDSRRSCLSLACLRGVNTLQPDAVFGVGVVKDGDAVAISNFDDFPGERIGRGRYGKKYEAESNYVGCQTHPFISEFAYLRSPLSQ